jgi:hypothetical protein
MNAPLHREMPATVLDSAAVLTRSPRQWDGDIVRQITDYIAIPAKSPGFDKDWASTATSRPCCATPRPGSRRRRSRA